MKNKDDIKTDVESLAKAAAAAHDTAAEAVYIERLNGYAMAIATCGVDIDVQKLYADAYESELGIITAQTARWVGNEGNGNPVRRGVLGDTLTWQAENVQEGTTPEDEDPIIDDFDDEEPE